MPFQSLSSFIVIPITHLHKSIIHAPNPGFRQGNIKCVCTDVYAAGRKGIEAACFVCILHIWDSAKRSPSLKGEFTFAKAVIT